MCTLKNRLGEAVLTSTDILYFEQKYEKYRNFYLKTLSCLVVKFSIYWNRHVFVKKSCLPVVLQRSCFWHTLFYSEHLFLLLYHYKTQLRFVCFCTSWPNNCQGSIDNTNVLCSLVNAQNALAPLKAKKMIRITGLSFFAVTLGCLKF